MSTSRLSEQITILIVDDETAITELMAARFLTRNFNVFKANNGNDALDVLNKNNMIDVVILDVKMPGLDGLETLKLIKEQHPLVEVIMLTGFPTVKDAIDSMKLGAYDYLKKVVDFEQLLTMIKLASDKKLKHDKKIIEAKNL
ncbi:MAG: response regulator [Nitrospirae bacterium]|nr:response regulator [Nitrospirota bacterium]MBF0541744.1 response regulator [Nitrospirota bacterium]